MTTRFAQLESRLVGAVEKHLSNVVAQLDGVDTPGQFDREYMQAFDGMASSQPKFGASSTSLAAATNASFLVVDGATYRVRNIQPDSHGWTELLLELQ
jgi:hypothetical protein